MKSLKWLLATWIQILNDTFVLFLEGIKIQVHCCLNGSMEIVDLSELQSYAGISFIEDEGHIFLKGPGGHMFGHQDCKWKNIYMFLILID